MYHALYRKYRPMDFDSVVGQDAIIKTLKNSIKNNIFSHAYMFFGPRGTGKTTVSKIFARNINCLSPIDGMACKKCDSCEISFSDNCVDIIEIDAASNNGVDEIRELKNNINLVPSQLKYKVYIIDEVHMLSIGAFNALLKTLEEPPSHVIFILATTDPQKVPETIVSRCQCFSFKRISEDDIKSKISDVCIKENIDIESLVVDKIAMLCDGGLRDALGYLDKMVSYSDSTITIGDFNDVNGIVDDSDLNNFLKNMLIGNFSIVLSDISRFNSCGKNIIQVIVQLINYIRDLIVDYYLSGINNECFSMSLLQELVNLLNEKLVDIKKSGNPKIYFEMLILKFINDFVKNDSKFFQQVNTNIDKDNNFITDLNNNDLTTELNSDSNDNENEDGNSENVIAKNVSNKDFSPSKIINLNEIISCRINNTMATADKSLLKNEIEKFSLLKDYSFDQNIGSLVNSLLDSKIRACGKNNMIISYSSDGFVSQNLENIISLNDVYNKITNSNIKIAIVTDKEWENIKIDYISRIRSNNPYHEVEEPDFLFEDSLKNDIISSSAIDLFGNDIVEFE